MAAFLAAARRLVAVCCTAALAGAPSLGGARTVHADVTTPASASPNSTSAPATTPASSSASAEATSHVAVLPLQVEGALSEGDRERLTAALVEGLARGSFTVVTPASDPGGEGVARCDTPACLVEFSRAAAADYLVSVDLRVGDREYEVDIELLDGSTATVLATTHEGCDICGISDAASLMNSAAATLRHKLDALAKGPAMVTIASEPGDAIVTLDGEVVGTTPLERQVSAGKHIVRATKEGYVSVEREVMFVQGVAEQLRFELEKVPSRLPKRPWGIASLAVGIATLGAGVGLIALHDMPYDVGSACQPPANLDANGECRYLWNTKWYGMSAVLAGAALATLGVAVLMTTSKRAARGKHKANKTASRRRRPNVMVGPGSLVVEGRF